MQSVSATNVGVRRLARALSALCLVMTSLVSFGAPPAQGQALPVVSISDVSVTEINGTPGIAYKNVLITFSVSGTRTGPVTVTYSTVGTGSATPDLDYRDFSAPVTISTGQTAVTRAVRVYGDTEPEPTETFEVHLSNPTDVTIGDGIAVVTINDNDNYVPPAGPTISIADVSVAEQDGPGSVTVGLTLSEASPTPVTVDLATADGTAKDVTDYLAVNGTVTFPSNQTTASQVIGIVGDTEFEPTETFTVGLSNPSGAAIADGSSTVTITDNDPEPPGVPDLSVSDETVNENDGTVTVTITADETSPNPVTFDLATSDGSATAGDDYTAVPTTGVTLPANTLSVTQSVAILEDSIGESPETFNVVISNVVGGTIIDGTGVVTINDNDAPACTDGPYVSIGDITLTETNGQKNVLITFTRSYAAPSNQTTRFYVDTVDGTALAGEDYVDRQNQLVVIKTGLTKTLAYKILGDTTAEPTETFQLRAENPMRACIDPNNNTGTITIIDNDGPPIPAVSISDASTTETDGASTVGVTVSLSQTSLSPVTVELSTADGSANGGTDYVPLGATAVTINPGDLTATVPIGIVGDDDYEPTETFTASLANPTNAVIGSGTATITIFDDEPSPPAVSIADASTTETDAGSTVNVTVSVDQQSASPISVLLTTADATAEAGQDYVAVNQQLVTIAANTSSVIVSLSIVGDDIYEPTENFTASLSGPTNAIIGDGAATITIFDDEDPPPPVPNISVADATTTESDGASSVEVTVTLDQSTADTVNVDLATADGTAIAGSDYTATGTTTLTFAPGDVSETVTITILGDAVPEPSETFEVNLSNAANGNILDGTGVVTINDDDAPACTAGPDVTVSDVTVTETEFTQNAIVTFTRSYSTNLSTRFFVDTIDGTAVAPGDYTARVNQLIVIQGGQTTKTLAFKIQGDTIAEPIENFLVKISNPTRGCIDQNNDTGTITIIDNDGGAPTVSVADVSTTETDTTSSVGVTVSLDQLSLSPVTVQVTTADGSANSGSDYIDPGSAAVTIPAGQLTATLPIGIVGDDEFEPTETFTVNLSSPTSATIGTGTATVTILDDEPVPPVVSIADTTTTETDAASSVDVTVSLDTQSASPVTVVLDTADGTAVAGEDYVAASGQLVTIPANTSSVTVPLSIVGDLIFELSETFAVSLSGAENAVIGAGTATVTIFDNDPQPATIAVADASTTETDAPSTVDVMVSLDSQSAAPVTVLLTTSDGTAISGSDYVGVTDQLVTIPANTSSVAVPLGIIGDDTYEQTETFSVSLSSPTNGFIADGSATITIFDDEPVPPGVSIADASTTETDSSSSVDLTVSLSSESNSAVTVLLSTADDTAAAGDDYVAITDQLVTIPANTSSVTVPLSIVGDTIHEQTETLTVSISSPTNAVIGDGTATVTIADNDPIPPVRPQISIADLTTTETDGASTIDATITFDQPSANTITVDLATMDGTAVAGSDYAATTVTPVTFAPGETIKTVQIGIIGDTVEEPTESFTINLTNAVDGDIVDGTAVVTIFDDDSTVCGSDPLITVADVSVEEGDVSTKNVAVTFSIPFPQELSTRFFVDTENVTATAPSDFSARTGQLVVIAGGATSKQLPIVINGDTLDEGDETLNVRISNPTRGCIDPNDDFGVFTILDDDGPPVPQISIADATTAETDGPSTVDVTLSVDIQSATPITVQLDTIDGSATAPGDYVAQAATTVTIPANTSSVTHTINIVGDTGFEPTEDFQVALSSPSANAEIVDGSATVTITDNDPLPPGDPDISIGDVTVTEQDQDIVAQVTVGIDEIDDIPVTVDLTTSDGTATAGSDYTAVSGATVTIAAGQLTATHDITILGDDIDEGGDETFTVSLSNESANANIIDGSATVTIVDDDFVAPTNPQLSILDVNVVEGNGTPPTATKNVTLTFEVTPGSIKPPGQVTFMWETIPTGSASQGDTAADDYPYGRSVDPGNPTIDLPVTMPMPDVGGASVIRTRTIQIYGDNLEEADETFEVHLFNVSTNVDVGDGIGVVTIEDNDGPPEISIDDVTVAEGGNATLTLTLDRAIGQQIEVQVDTADGTAVAPLDYTAAVAQTATFAPNTLTTSVDIPVIDDGQFEGADEDFTVNLSNPVNAAILDGQGVVTITDAQSAPQLSIGDVSFVEGDDTFKSVLLNITLDTVSSQEVTVRFGTINGTAIGGTASPADFQRVNGSPTSGPLLTFAPGQTAKTVSVKIFGDTEDEADEEFTVQMYAPTNATFLKDSATVTIVDNDQLARISVADLTVLEGDGSTVDDFVLADATLSLDIPSAVPVDVQVDSVDGTATAGTDYEPITAQTVTFPVNETTATVQVKVFNNDILDGNRDFVLNLSNPVAAAIEDAQATVTIDDNDDLPKVSVSDLTVTEGDGSPPGDFVNADVAVTLDSPATASVTVDLSTSDGTATAGTDYEAVTAQQVNIPAGTTSVIVPIKVYGDDVVEPDEDFTVTLSNQSANVDPGSMTATVTIDDNEVVPEISIAGVTVTEGDTAFQFAMLNLTLSDASNLPVTVELDTEDGSATAGSDYIAVVDQVVTFDPGATTATAFVQVLGDYEVEPTEDLTVTLSNPVNGVITGGPATVTILDQDTARQISIADASITEGDAGTESLDLVLTTDGPVSQTVTVELTTADGTATAGQDYQALNGELATFNPGSDTTTVSVDIIGDTEYEQIENFTVTLANPVNAVVLDGTATVTINENDVDPSLPNLRVEDIYVTEGDDAQKNVELVFVLEQEMATTIRATATMVDVTATSGAAAGDGDYVPIIDLPLVFSPGDRILKRVVKINGDTDYEGNETARILLRPNTTPTVTDDANIIDGEGILTILDSEVGPGDGPQLFVANVTQQEGGNVGFNNMEVTFALDEPSGAAVFFDVAALDGNTGGDDATLADNDFQDPASHLVMPIRIPPGEQIVKRNFRVNGDTKLEGNEVFRLAVQNVLGAVPGGNGEGIMTILDTDLPLGTPTVNVMDIVDGENGDLGTENATIKFYLDRPHDQTVTVQYQPVDGTLTVAEGDYDPNVASPTVSFLPGEQVAEKPVIINRDNTYGGVEYLDVVISNPTGGAVIGDGVGRVTIYDDEQQANLPGIHFTTTDIVERDVGKSIANLKGYIDKPFSGTVTATFGFVDGTARQGIDYTNATGATGPITTIRWTGGEQVSETKADILGDPYFEGNETFQMELLSVVGDAQIIDAFGTVIILDNNDESDPPEPTFNDADIAVAVSADKTTANGGETVVYTVAVTNNGPDEGSGVEATLTLPAGLTLGSLGGCANGSGTTCTIGTLVNGATSQFTVSATVDLIASGVITATATASSIDLDSPTSNNTDTVDVTAMSPYDNDTVYVSSTTNGSVGGVTFNDEDILAFDRSTGQWSMFFDGDDVGLTTLDGFNIVDFTPGATVIELSMAAQRSIGTLGLVDDADVIRFTGTTGPATSGTWEMVIDGSDLGLTTAAENVDVVASIGDGDIAFSTIGSLSGNSFTAQEQDIVRFTGTTGAATSGTFSLVADGSTIAMTVAAEDINGAWIDPSGDIYLTTIGNLSVNGFTADLDDIVILTDTAAGTFEPYFDGDLVGFGAENIDGVHIVGGP